MAKNARSTRLSNIFENSQGRSEGMFFGECVTDNLLTSSLLAEWGARLSILGQFLEGKKLVLQSEDSFLFVFFSHRVF